MTVSREMPHLESEDRDPLGRDTEDSGGGRTLQSQHIGVAVRRLYGFARRKRDVVDIVPFLDPSSDRPACPEFTIVCVGCQRWDRISVRWTLTWRPPSRVTPLPFHYHRAQPRTTVEARPTTASAPTRSCSRMLALGAIHARGPTWTPPQRIAVAITKAPSSMWQLWAMWTRLSTLTWSSITVSSKVPRSIHVLAPTHQHANRREHPLSEERRIGEPFASLA